MCGKNLFKKNAAPGVNHSRRWSFLFILALLVFFLPGHPWAAAATYYVSNGGSDSTGGGSIGNPFQTVQYTLDNAAGPGDTVVLRGGTYNEAIRVREPDITLRSHTGEKAIIQTPYNDGSIYQTVRLDVDSDRCRLTGLELVGGYYYVIKLETRWDWGDPGDRTGTSGIIIEDCVIHGSGRDCIKITPNCDDITIRRCEIYDSGLRYDGNAEGIDNVNGDRTVVRDCHIHDIATTGVYCKGGATGCIIERTRVHNCGSLGISLGFDTSPEYFDLTANPNRYENIDGTVRNCVVGNTGYAGIGIYAAQNAKVYNNTVVDTAADGQTPLVFGLAYQDWVTGGQGGYRPASVNPDIKNNLFIQLGGGTAKIVQIRYSTDLGGISALAGMPDMDYNTYFVTGSTGLTCIFEDRRPAALFNGNISQWRAHVSGAADSREEAPLLNGDYTLTASSPCRDSGLDLGTVFKDDFNQGLRPAGAQWDRGAFEFGAAAVVPHPDLNGDGKVDILWRNTASGGGQNVVWYMDGISRTGAAYLPRLANIDWHIMGTGDFNGDGKTDILWRYTADDAGRGQNAVWFMDGITRTGVAALPRLTSPDWEIAAAADFNGDGKPDILWRCTTAGGTQGQNVVWTMNGTTRTGAAYLPKLSNLNWRIVGAADFNGDGGTDILWRYTADDASAGLNVVWYMNGMARTGVAMLPRLSDLDWKIADTADFNGDGKTDILWRNTGTGSNGGKNVTWFMDGIARTGVGALPTAAGLDWEITN